MRSDADFDATPELADCPRLGIGLSSLEFAVTPHKLRSLAAAEDSATTSENVRCKTGARNRVTQSQRAQDRTHCTALVPRIEDKDVPIKIDKDVVKRASGVHRPAFDTNAEITMEKIFKVDATAPGMVSLNVAVVWPRVSCENVSAQIRR